jgi:integrase
LTKRVAGCTAATLRIYGWWLRRLKAEVPDVTPLGLRTFFAGLQHRSTSQQHQAYRPLKNVLSVVCRDWVLAETPLRGFTVRTPKTLPDVPTEDDLRAALATCPETLDGVRNRTLLLVLADSGLRANEVLRLLVEDWRSSDHGPVRARRQGPEG